jgi:F-type H+-transporting ATPase subunit b
MPFTLDPLAQLDPVTIGGVIVIFLVTLLVLRRIAFDPLIGVMERRDARIAAARAAKAEAEAHLAAVRGEREARAAVAAGEATRALEAAREEAAGRRRARLEAAGAEAEAILARGREEAQALRREEEARLADALRASAAATLARVLGTVDDASLRFVVQRVRVTSEGG